MRRSYESLPFWGWNTLTMRVFLLFLFIFVFLIQITIIPRSILNILCAGWNVFLRLFCAGIKRIWNALHFQTTAAPSSPSFVRSSVSTYRRRPSEDGVEEDRRRVWDGHSRWSLSWKRALEKLVNRGNCLDQIRKFQAPKSLKQRLAQLFWCPAGDCFHGTRRCREWDCI